MTARSIYQYHSNKYLYALQIADAEGLRFTNSQPPSTIVYAAMRLLGYKWDYRIQAWENWRRSYIVLHEGHKGA